MTTRRHPTSELERISSLLDRLDLDWGGTCEVPGCSHRDRDDRLIAATLVPFRGGAAAAARRLDDAA